MGVSIGPKIETGGLLTYIDSANVENPSTPLTYDYSNWIVGSGGIGNFGNWDRVNRIIASDPWGNDQVVWNISTDATETSGGMYNSYKPIDPTKLYRMSFWEKRVTNGTATAGNYYFGCNANNGGIGNMGSGTANTNPYFWYTSLNGVPINLWYLVVGHIHPYTNTSYSDHVDSGRYTISQGKIGGISTDYQWRSENTTARSRTLAIYHGNTTDMTHHSLYPRFDLCDGNEPSIDDLLHGRHEQIKTKYKNKRIGVSDSRTASMLSFNNDINDIITLEDISNLNDDFSVNCWIKFNNFTNNTPILIRDGDTTYNFNFGVNTSGVISVSQLNSESFTGGSLSVNTWYNISVNVINKVCKIYIDGVEESSFTFTNSFNDVGYIKMGSLSNGFYLNAEIGIIMIYDKGLSDSKISQNYNSFKCRF